MRERGNERDVTISTQANLAEVVATVIGSFFHLAFCFEPMSIYDLSAQTLSGDQLNLGAALRGRVGLITCVASD